MYRPGRRPPPADGTADVVAYVAALIASRLRVTNRQKLPARQLGRTQ
jgi:hypothetical protein